MRLSCGTIKIETFEMAAQILLSFLAMNREKRRIYGAKFGGLRKLGKEKIYNV